MTWTPKPGERVTSPLLVGEWVVVRSEAVIVWLAHSNGAAVSINREHVSPVAPPLPPEPRVGSVVRAHGKMWLRQAGRAWYDQHDTYAAWPHLAAAPDLTHVAPPLPPEPPVGSVVRAHGKMWLRQAGQGWYDQHDKYAAWPHLAAAPDFSAVAPVEDIADWLWDAGIRKVIIDNMRFAFGGTETT